MYMSQAENSQICVQLRAPLCIAMYHYETVHTDGTGEFCHEFCLFHLTKLPDLTSACGPSDYKPQIQLQRVYRTLQVK